MEYILETHALCKQFGQHKAVSNVSMHIQKGAIYGFVGKNGAGKTTLIRLLCGLQLPTSGDFTLYGRRSTERDFARTRRKIGAVVESCSIYLDMSAQENLKQQYHILGLPSYDGLQELLQLVKLDTTGKKKCRDFSLGMRQRLGIAIALAGDPDFLILDEPVNGLDPQGIIEIRELILKLNREYGITVLISSHILDELAKLATHYGFIDNGCLIKEIEAEELKAVCRKCVNIEVNNTRTLSHVLDAMGLEYTVLSDTRAAIYGEVRVSQLALALHPYSCEIITITEHNENLESYFVNLVGGEHCV